MATTYDAITMIQANLSSWYQALARLAHKVKILLHQYRDHPQGYGTGLKHVLLLFWHTRHPLWYLVRTVASQPEHYQACCQTYLSRLSQAVRNQTFSTLEQQAPRTLRSVQWQHHRFFRFIKTWYLLTCELIDSIIERTPMSAALQTKIHWFSQWYISALSPANIYFINPTVIETTWRSKGLNWLHGLNHWLSDCITNQGYIQFNQDAHHAQTIGIDLATTPGHVVYQNELLQLLYYQPTTTKRRPVPILIVPSWINKYYIFDLRPKNSIIRWLTKQGFSVFIISWCNPDEHKAHFTPADYIHQGIIKSIEYIRQACQTDHLHTIGYCLGGTLLACALALWAKRNASHPITSLTLIASLLDFNQAGRLAALANGKQLNWYQTLIDQYPLWDGRRLATVFNLLEPNEYIWPYWVNRYALAKPAPYLDALIWSADLTHSTKAMQRFYLFDLYQLNCLARQRLYINDQRPLLANITTPTFGVCFTDDLITPKESCLKSFQQLSQQPQIIIAHGGHFSGLVNLPHHCKRHYQMIQPTAQSRQSGSWWSAWDNWLLHLEQPIHTALQPIIIKNQPPAPGQYCLKSIIPTCCHC